jgi:hypothetical protein
MVGFSARMAFGMLFSILSMMGGAPVAAANVVEVHYVCEGDLTLAVRQSSDLAEVRFSERVFRLSRRSSSFGERFSSADAALAIDSKTAAFVAGDHLQLRSCAEASRSPSH